MGCGEQIAAAMIKTHLETKCPLREVPCRHKKCKARMQACDQKEHEQNDCEWRYVVCEHISIPKEAYYDEIELAVAAVDNSDQYDPDTGKLVKHFRVNEEVDEE